MWQDNKLIKHVELALPPPLQKMWAGNVIIGFPEPKPSL